MARGAGYLHSLSSYLNSIVMYFLALSHFHNFFAYVLTNSGGGSKIKKTFVIVKFALHP